MRATKDSGFEWIGIIPSEWGLSRIGQVYRLRNTKVSDTDYPPLSVTNKGIVPQLDTAAKTNAHDDRKLVKKGDFAINSRSDRRGSCGISDYDGSVSLINTILAPLNEMNPGYYDWLFHTIQFGDEFYKFGHGIVDDLWTTGWQEMKKITIPTPPLSEQHRIADFLDTKCAEIDALTADIQTQIDTLEQYKRSVITETVTKGLNPDAEMKDSGVFYMAPMNASWRLTKIGYICTKLSRSFVSEDTALICSNKGKVQVRADDLTGIMVSDDNAMQGIRAGDIAIHGMDTWHGAIALSEFDGKITRVVHVCDSTEDNRMKTILFHRDLDAYKNLVGCLESISKDQDFINKMNGISMVSMPKNQAKTLPEFDVFISHANKDKENLIEELYQSLNKLGIKIFYDKESLEWGDNWKDRILNGTKKAEFAIIVISENFFDREWTERELNEFLNRQNRNGQKLILPILHNITVSQFWMC